jgi:nitrogen fixation NifU-like protein
MSDLRDLYQEVILDHGKRPRNFRALPVPDRAAKGDNPLCGDRIEVFVKLDADGRIADAAFQGRGCAISQASASLMTELVRGKTEAEARDLFAAFHTLCTSEAPPSVAPALAEDFARLEVMSGVRHYPMRVKCATLAWHTLTAALDGGAKTASTE